MKRRIPESSSDLAGHASPIAPGSLEPESQQVSEDRAVGRRALLTRGGVVVAGVVGAGVAGAAVAGPANAAVNDALLQGNVNSVGTDVAATEVTATNNLAPTPTVIVTNPGSRVVNTITEATPPLRLTQSPVVNPSTTGEGGDMVATSDGELWFTHGIPTLGNFPAIVHTDLNSNSFAPLVAPKRILDTRTSAGRANVLDKAGKFDSTGRLLAGKTIHIKLTSLVFFGDAVTANLTVTKPAKSGFLTLWSGAVARPNAPSIHFSAGQTIANLTVSRIAQFKTTTDTIAIYASATTHVILDVAGFTVREFFQVNPAFLAPAMSGSSRAQQLTQALAKRRNLNW